MNLGGLQLEKGRKVLYYTVFIPNMQIRMRYTSLILYYSFKYMFNVFFNNENLITYFKLFTIFFVLKLYVDDFQSYFFNNTFNLHLIKLNTRKLYFIFKNIYYASQSERNIIFDSLSYPLCPVQQFHLCKESFFDLASYKLLITNICCSVVPIGSCTT